MPMSVTFIPGSYIGSQFSQSTTPEQDGRGHYRIRDYNSGRKEHGGQIERAEGKDRYPEAQNVQGPDTYGFLVRPHIRLSERRNVREEICERQSEDGAQGTTGDPPEENGEKRQDKTCPIGGRYVLFAAPERENDYRRVRNNADENHERARPAASYQLRSEDGSVDDDVDEPCKNMRSGKTAEDAPDIDSVSGNAERSGDDTEHDVIVAHRATVASFILQIGRASC